MKRVILTGNRAVPKRGVHIGAFVPNVCENTFFTDEADNVIGFYLRELPPKLRHLILVADQEARSERVPKSMLNRVTRNKDGTYDRINQWSVILGSVSPKPHLKRPYPARSSVHNTPSTRTLTKAMNRAGVMILQLIQKYAPPLYEQHKHAALSNTAEKWRWANLFTGSIINCNASAPLHRDDLNVKNTLNAIVCCRRNAQGGHLHIPQYGATIEQSHLSLIVYPAWRDYHAVTPIKSTFHGGYRNTYIWYVNRNLK